MDATQTPLNLKHALAYLLARHGLRYAVSTMHVYCNTGRGPRHRKCGQLQFLPSDLDAWVAERVARSAARTAQRRAARERAQQQHAENVAVLVTLRLPRTMRKLDMWNLVNAEPYFRSVLARFVA